MLRCLASSLLEKRDRDRDRGRDRDRDRDGQSDRNRNGHTGKAGRRHDTKGRQTVRQ